MCRSTHTSAATSRARVHRCTKPSNVTCAGVNDRTNAAGVSALRQTLPDVEFVEFDLPHFRGPSEILHLLSLINLIAPDLAVVLGRVETAGGKVVVQKRQISPEYGYMAVFLDSEGNKLWFCSPE